MKKKIAFCQENLDNMGTQFVLDELEKAHADKFEIRTSRCLAACGDCYTACIADYHGKLLVAATPEDLLNDILSLYNQQ